MFKIGAKKGKRTVALALFVVALGVAVYLNWFMTNQSEGTTNTDVLTGSALGQAMYVNGDASDGTNENYFVSARTQREETRAKEIDQLDEMINHIKSDGKTVEEATEQKIKITGYMETENNIETLIKAKGFKECVAVVAEDTVSLVVQTDGLTAAQTVQIQEIIQGQSGISLENIKIIEVK